jgi:hypothetical protein
MAVFANIGLVPLWFGEEHSAKTSFTSINIFFKEKGRAKGRPAAQWFLDSLSLALQCQHGIMVTRKYAENIGCKVFCLACTEGSDEHFSNLTFQNHPRISKSVSSKLITVTYMFIILGFRTSVVHGPLIDCWAFGGRFWLLPHLLLQFGSMTGSVTFDGQATTDPSSRSLCCR